MRNMSFWLTTKQMRNGTKTVTRRLGWYFLKPGDVVMAIVKGQGLKKGEKVERIRPIRITSVRTERLVEITKEECVKEGFPELTPGEFVEMFLRNSSVYARKLPHLVDVNRIEFEHIYNLGEFWNKEQG